MITAVVDNMLFSGFARAGRLDVLEQLVADMRVVTTTEVLDELRNGVGDDPRLEPATHLAWVEEVYLRGLPAMNLFAVYAKRLGSGPRNIGETTVLAWAELNRAVAVIDDEKARKVARERGVERHGTLWLIARGISRGLLTMPHAAQLIDDLQDGGMYLPCSGVNFPAWAHQHGLFAGGALPGAHELTAPDPQLKS